MRSAVRVLHLEDSPRDAALIADLLAEQGVLCEVERAETRKAFEAALARGGFDIVLADNNLPDYDGISAVRAVQEKRPNTPVIVISGSLGADEAMSCLRLGATDYLLKDRLQRLVPAVRRALSEARNRERRERAEAEVRRNEERFRLLVENISEMVVVVGEDGCVQYASPALEVALRVPLAGAPHARVFEEVHPDDMPRARSLLSAPVAEPVELRMRAEGGTWRLFSWRTMDLSREPSVAGLVLIAEDVTDRRRLEKQALQAQKLDSIGRLAGGLSHDFNNLLTVVLGYSELALAHPGVDGTLRALLEDIHHAGERASALTRQLLAFGRRQPAAPRLVDPNELVRGLDALLRRTLGEDIVVTVDLDPEIGLIHADPAQIEQVLINLLFNARDAMPGGGQLSVHTRRSRITAQEPRQISAPPGDYVLISVRDSGSGMSEEVQARLFEPFFTTKETGTGLGLAGAYGIVRQAGGGMSFSSRVGEGTTVDVYLPAARGALDRGDAPVVPAVVGGRERILVVEDEPSVRTFVTQVLGSLGYEVVAAGDGPEALELARTSVAPFSLLLSDMVMPGMSGVEVAAALSGQMPGLKVLLMSGYSGERPGASEPPILPKPFTPSGLARRVREVLDGIVPEASSA